MKMSGAYYIETYGCQMNDHDSEKMAALMEQMGLRQVDSADQADVIVINTCSIREKAEHKVYSALGRLKPLKQKNSNLITVVAGCVAQQEKTRLLKRVDHLDAVVGTHCISALPSIVEEIRQSGRRIEATEFADDVASLHAVAPCKGPSPVLSYVTVMQGCSNFCSYCVVPYTRGPEQSRSLQEITEEVKMLLDRGVKEVTLLGQNVNAYGADLADGSSFSKLLQRLNNMDGLERIRFTTSHPRDFNGDLADAMAELKCVCEHIHLPLQSGSDRILKAMRRGYSRDEYMEKIHMLRERIPHVAITTDIIVGFPGEADEDFDLTVSALEEIRYDQIFSFKYSPRPGTRARNFTDQVLEGVKVARLEKIHMIQDAITQSYHRDAEGSQEEILIEGLRERTGQPFGRTRRNKIVNIELGEGLKPGDLTMVKITKGLKHSLLGVNKQ